MHIYTHYVFHNYKVSGNSVERFQRSCANKKNRTDGLTDWLTDGSKTLYPPQLVAWGIIIGKRKVHSCCCFSCHIFVWCYQTSLKPHWHSRNIFHCSYISVLQDRNWLRRTTDENCHNYYISTRYLFLLLFIKWHLTYWENEFLYMMLSILFHIEGFWISVPFVT